jgi:hypothetical protein
MYTHEFGVLVISIHTQLDGTKIGLAGHGKLESSALSPARVKVLNEPTNLFSVQRYLQFVLNDGWWDPTRQLMPCHTFTDGVNPRH